MRMRRLAAIAVAATLAVPAAFAQSNLEAAAQKALHASRFKNVHVTIANGIATLTGSVDMYSAKLNAESKIRHVHGVSAIRDQIQVNGPEIPDEQLAAKLQKAIAYGLLGYVPVAFQAIGVEVRNGVVLLNGHAAGPIAASDAVAIVENTKGVKDVINDIQIDPVSPMDEQIRVEEFRAIYGFPMLNQYAIDPEKPIRIQVENGHVTLYGEVQTQAEKNAAGVRANTVPGVFSVKNELMVANGNNEKPSK